MEQQKTEPLKFEFQIKHIQVNEVFLTPLPTIKEIPRDGFTFNLNIVNKVEFEKSWGVITTNIDIGIKDLTKKAGSISVIYVYEIKDLANVVTEVDGEKYLPQDVAQILNMLSVTTTRGIMFGVFKGTLLHNAILPMLDPNKFIPDKIIPKEPPQEETHA